MIIPRNCDYCQEEYNAESRYLRRGQGRFCSRMCAARFFHPTMPIEPNAVCALCGIKFFAKVSRVSASKSGLLFCSRAHRDVALRVEEGFSALHPPHYKDGRFHYRTRAFRTYGKICVGCGYDEDTRMLDVDHIDSNRKNNSIENLQVLCVWCHAKKTRANWPKDE